MNVTAGMGVVVGVFKFSMGFSEMQPVDMSTPATRADIIRVKRNCFIDSLHLIFEKFL
jgi:hypothetical protein